MVQTKEFFGYFVVNFLIADAMLKSLTCMSTSFLQKLSSGGVVLKRCSLRGFFAGLRAATLLKKRLWFRCFPVNFAKKHLRWLLPILNFLGMSFTYFLGLSLSFCISSSVKASSTEVTFSVADDRTRVIWIPSVLTLVCDFYENSREIFLCLCFRKQVRGF